MQNYFNTGLVDMGEDEGYSIALMSAIIPIIKRRRDGLEKLEIFIGNGQTVMNMYDVWERFFVAVLSVQNRHTLCLSVFKTLAVDVIVEVAAGLLRAGQSPLGLKKLYISLQECDEDARESSHPIFPLLA